MMTTLAGLFLAYLKGVCNPPKETLIRCCLLIVGFYTLVYFWISVYPI